MDFDTILSWSNFRCLSENMYPAPNPTFTKPHTYVSLKVARLLCECGADKDDASLDGATPLLVASQDGHLEVVSFLSKAGADKNKTMVVS